VRGRRDSERAPNLRRSRIQRTKDIKRIKETSSLDKRIVDDSILPRSSRPPLELSKFSLQESSPCAKVGPDKPETSPPTTQQSAVYTKVPWSLHVLATSLLNWVGGRDPLSVGSAVAFGACSRGTVTQPTPRAPPARHTILQHGDSGTGRVPGGVNHLTGFGSNT
jgi:hypothetical protein